MKRRPYFAFAIFLLAASADSQTGVQPTGLFSDMHHVKAAGDVVGTEVFITYGVDQYWAQVQNAEGEPGAPVLVKARIQGNKLSFDLPAGSSFHGHFDGELQKVGLKLKGQIDGVSYDFDLKRRNSYWQ